MKALRTAINLVIEWVCEAARDTREWWNTCEEDECEACIVVLGHVFSRRQDWDDDECIVWWCDDIDVELQYHHEQNLWIALQYGFERGYFVEVDRGIGSEAEDAMSKIWRVIWNAKGRKGLS
jgi:hypothetical protein